MKFPQTWFASTAVIALLASGAAGCNPPAAQEKKAAGTVDLLAPNPGTPLAKVGPATITVEELSDRINRLNPYIRARYKSADKKKEYLETIIRTEVLALKALEAGLGNDAQIRDRIMNELAQKYITTEFDGKMKDKLVTDEDVKKYYDEHNDNYNKPEAVRVSHIFFAAPRADAAKYAAARKKAEGVLKQAIAKDADRKAFADLARANSDDEASKRLGGDLNYFSKQQLAETYGPEFADAAFGEPERNKLIAKLVETEKGIHIVKTRGRREAMVKSFEDMKTPIRSRLYYERRSQALDEWIAGLSKSLGVSIQDANLDKVSVSDEKPPPRPTMAHDEEDAGEPAVPMGHPPTPAQNKPGKAEKPAGDKPAAKPK